MALNFDAKLSLDVSEFLASITKAENAVKELRTQLSTPMTMPSATGAGGTDKGLETLTQQRQRASQESMRQIAEERAMDKAAQVEQRARIKAEVAEQSAAARAKSQMDRINAKTEWQAEMMRKKAMDDRIKDHQTLSSLSDQTISQDQKARAQASASIKNQMQEREAMNKQHAQANAMNDRFDAARKASADASVRNSARERYALYDVAAAYQQVQQIATQALSAMIGTAAQYERAFANVARTSEFTSLKIGESARVMQYSLTQLAEQIPVSFGKITEIATIGNQLNIAQGDLVAFTKTVAQFSTITGISVDQAALSFGRIGELLTKTGQSTDYNALGSSIAYAGVKAVATETQILSVTKEIATTAKMAKFSTQEVVGLATALSSLGIAPEAARGSIIRTFALINQAVGEGGSKLDAYASVAKKSAKDFSTEWTKNGQVAFDSFLNGLQNMSDSGQNLDTVLRGLGIKNVRDIQTIQKLGDNYDVYSESIFNANKGYSEAIFLSEAYGKVQDTVAAKIEIVQNKFNNFLASTGQISFPGVNLLLDVISNVIDELNAFARNPAGQTLLTMGTLALALAAAIAAVNAIFMIGKATMMAYAVSVEATSVAASAATASINTMGAAAGATAVRINGAKLAMEALKVAGKATLWLAGIYAAVEVFNLLGDNIQKAADASGYYRRKSEELVGGFAGLQEAITADNQALNDYAVANKISIEAAAQATDAIMLNTGAFQQNDQGARDAVDAHNVLVTAVGRTDLVVGSLTSNLASQTIAVGENAKAWMQNAIMQSDSFKNISNDKTFQDWINHTGLYTKNLQYSFDNAVTAAVKGKDSLDKYFNTIDKGVSSSDGIGISAKGGIDKLKEAIMGIVYQMQLLGITALETKKKIDLSSPEPDKWTETTKTLTKARTIWDYIAEVQGKLKTAFDWRYAAQNAADQLYSGWKKVSDSFKEAAKAVRDLKTSMGSLVADRSILEYQLSVALRYGDTLRANAIQAELNANADKIAQNKTEQVKATQEASRALTGNSDAAIRNRQTMQGLVQTSLEYLTQLKTTTKDTTSLVASAKTSKADFMAQGIAMGFNAEQLALYSKSFDDFIAITKGTSGKLDLSMETYLGFKGADAALHKWKTDNADLTLKVRIENPDWTAWQKTQQDILKGLTQNEIDQYHKAQVSLASDKKAGRTSAKSIQNIVINFEKEYGTGYAVGGLVTGPGNGTSDSIKANLSNGEYVINAAAVSRVGVGFLNALNNQQGLAMPASVMNTSSTISGSNVVYLSPDDRALLRAAIDRPVNLYTDNARIAQSANDGNVLLAQRGRN